VLRLSDDNQAILSMLVPMAQSLRDAGDLAALRAWLETLSEHECTLLVRWMQYLAAAIEPVIPQHG
jgi:hypothetical protein